MQDKYAGDAGDFGKFVLLRQLLFAAGSGFRLGVNWYRVTLPEKSNNDGRHVDYLDPDNPLAGRFQVCDSVVWARLRDIVSTHNRSVRALEEAALLPHRTIYFSAPLPFGASPLKRRIVERQNWYAGSVSRFAPADAIFLDPDNGIQTGSVTMTRTRSVKYALREEICGYARNSDLVIIYNHRDRSPRKEYLQKFAGLRELLGRATSLKVLHFKRYSARDYAFFYRSGMSRLVSRLFTTLTTPPLSFLFEETASA